MIRRFLLSRLISDSASLLRISDCHDRVIGRVTRLSSLCGPTALDELDRLERDIRQAEMILSIFRQRIGQ